MAFLLVAAGVTGCAGVSDTVTEKSAPPPPSVWQTTVDRLGPDGRLPTAAALAAFALAVAPVPGVVAPSGPPETVDSASIAVGAVLARWSELTDGQRGAVRSALAGSGAAIVPAAWRRAAPVDPHLPCLTADSAGAAPYRAVLGEIEPQLSARLGWPLRIADKVFLSVNTKDLEHARMYAWPCADGALATGKINGCTIHINPSTIAAHGSDELRAFLVHELTHCFLYDRFGLAYTAMPAWYVEGAPTWTMAQLGASNTVLGSHWKHYLDTPTTALTGRAYDGVGFFAHLAETGTDVWRSIDLIGAAMAGKGATATAAGWAAAGPSAQFINAWGPGYVQGRYPGTPWTSSGPNLPPYQPALPHRQLADGGSVTVSAPPFAAAAEQLDVDATVLVATVNGGSGRLTVGGGADADLSAGPFCTVAQCACPADSGGAGTHFAPMSGGQAYVGVSGGQRAGAVTLSGFSLAQFCARPVASCLVGQWRSVGFAISNANVTESGGAGIRMRIDAKGRNTVDFAGMAPIHFDAHTSGTTVVGSFTFQGRTAGAIRLPAAGATTGPWQVTQGGGANSITVDVHLTSPITYDMKRFTVGAAAGAVAGGAVGSPQLTSGTWRCTGDTLVSTAPSAHGSWTLTRTGPA